MAFSTVDRVCMALLWAYRALNSPKLRFPARTGKAEDPSTGVVEQGKVPLANTELLAREDGKKLKPKLKLRWWD